MSQAKHDLEITEKFDSLTYSVFLSTIIFSNFSEFPIFGTLSYNPDCKYHKISHPS